VSTDEFLDDGNGRVRALRLHEVEFVDGTFVEVEGSGHEIEADFVFLALGFVGPEKGSWLDSLGVEYDARGNVARDDRYMTNQHGHFVAGDMGRGQSLIVWAIAEGRAAAAGVDAYLMGETRLPAPIKPTERPLL
jgi:glutamate synthase (NADPH/NADH) small chain